MDNPFGREVGSNGSTTPSSVSYILFKLAGQKILRTTKQLIKDEACPLLLGFKKITLNDLKMANGQDMFDIIARVASNLPVIENHIGKLSSSNSSEITLQLLTTLRDYVNLYQWLYQLITSNKAHIGNPIDNPGWVFEDEETNTYSRDIRAKLLTLMEPYIIDEAIDATKSTQ